MRYTLVYPGMYLRELKKPSLGIGAYLRRREASRELRSAVIGAYREKSTSIYPRTGAYLPRPDDDVVGIVYSGEAGYFRVDIRSPYYALLRASEDSLIEVGDVIRAKVTEFDLKINPLLSIRRLNEREEYGVIKEGIIVEVSPNKLGAILGRKLSNIQKIQDSLGVKIYPGRNGRFVISGDLDKARVVASFLERVERASPLSLSKIIASRIKSL